MAPTRFSSGPSLWSLSRYLRWDTRLAYTGMYPIPSVCQHAQPSTPNAEGYLRNQPEISVRRSTAKIADRYMVAQEEGPTSGVVDEAMEAFGQEVVAGMDLGDFHIAVAEFRADPDQGLAAAGEGLIEAGGEHAVFEAGGAEEGLLGGGDALDGEEFLGVDGLVAGDEVILEVGDF